ncbi:hypothetical protein [Runella sp.]|uniref:hypothetical protein n=1 Tax=Runella sp. TaxID=1960881 RepID=UPI003D0E1783
METTIASQWSNEDQYPARIIPLTPSDMNFPEGRKKEVRWIVGVMAISALAYGLYDVFFNHEEWEEATFVMGMCLPIFGLMYWMLMDRINACKRDGIKHVGMAVVVGKSDYKQNYRLELDWEFRKKLSSVLVTSETYDAVQVGDSIYIEVAPRIEWAVCVRKKPVENLTVHL